MAIEGQGNYKDRKTTDNGQGEAIHRQIQTNSTGQFSPRELADLLSIRGKVLASNGIDKRGR